MYITRERIISGSFVLITAISLSACLNPKRINKIVRAEYPTTALDTKRKSEFITISSPLVSADKQISQTINKTSNVLPLLLYWQWDYKNTCTINPRIPLVNLTNSIIAAANSKNLKSKLNGRRIELEVQKLPNMFSINDRGHLIWVIVYAIGWDVLTIRPEAHDLLVHYKLMEGNTEVKAGDIQLASPDKGIRLKVFQSIRKKTLQYLDTYNANMEKLGKQLVDQLITDVQG